MEDEVYSGVISYLKGSKKHTKRNAALYKHTSQGLCRIEIFDSKDQFEKRHAGKSQKKIAINLEKCLNIKLEPNKEGKKSEYSIELNFEEEKPHVLYVTDELELHNWLSSLSTVLFGKDDMIDSPLPKDVYFEVQIQKNDGARRLKLEGTYLLNVSPEDIELLHKDTKHPIIKWPLHLLRKYGRDKREFSLEAGRRCPSGEGMFYFTTDKYNAIFQVVEKNVKSLARRGRAASYKTPHSPDINQPPSPGLPPAPSLPPIASVYDDPLDVRKGSKDRAANVDDTYTYSEPIHLETPPTKNKPKAGKKPDKKLQGKTKAKPGTKPKVTEGPRKPPRKPDPSSVMIDDVTYGETSGFNGDAAYSSLDIGGEEIAETAYDSFNRDQWTGKEQGEPEDPYATASTYATASDISGSRLDDDDSVYDHVKR